MSEPHYTVTFRKPLPRIMRGDVACEIIAAVGEIPEDVDGERKRTVIGEQFIAIRALMLVIAVGHAERPPYAEIEARFQYYGFLSVHRDQIASVTYASTTRNYPHLPPL